MEIEVGKTYSVVQPPLKLEVGKTYANRKGERHRIVRVGSWFGDTSTPVYYSDTEEGWFENGAKSRISENDSDLVAEAVDSNTVAAVANQNWVAPEATHEFKHAGLIRAVLDGKVVQRRHGSQEWHSYDGDAKGAIHEMLDMSDHEWRLAPFVRWCPLGDSGNVFAHSLDRGTAEKRCRELGISHILRLEFDADTLATISAVTEDA